MSNPEATQSAATENPVAVTARLEFDARATGFSRALAHLDHAATKPRSTASGSSLV